MAQFEPPAPADDPRWPPAFEEWGVDPGAAAERVGRPLIAATDGRRKLQRRGEREELFDLVADPLELAPRAVGADDEGAVAALRAALDHPAATASRGPGAERRRAAADLRRRARRARAAHAHARLHVGGRGR